MRGSRWTRSEERAKRNVQWRESTLFFGLSRQTGSNGTGDEQISDAEFDHFIARVVTPLFPDGLTILDAHGQYLNHHGALVRERSKYVLIFHPDEPAYHDKLEYIWRNYTLDFQQESILLTSTIVDFCFNDVCLGTPIPDLQAEFESLQAKLDRTAAQLQALEDRQALRDDGSRWWGVGVVIGAGLLGLVGVASLIFNSRERWRNSFVPAEPS
ncbi:lipoprotein, putative [Acanthamoeba castellanii str. Neff]|uniref:Lipoprotein, putative n=1 Tax=Acanthamoeba castellanii (strain ATCC 30010 / Neff) TaxID=1257118 RepID=L8HM57_ACACF|nr:lipoprotein, putative [Acanthamoeba castellanii str. Neff]ELR25743.1 lipoprotein, putative [Acanthamoeba castellanii str. Neff]